MWCDPGMVRCVRVSSCRVCEQFREMCWVPADSLDEESTARMVLEWSSLLCSLISTEAQDQQILWMAKLRFPLLALTSSFLKISVRWEGKFTQICSKELPSSSCSLPPKKRHFPLKAQESAAVKPPQLPPAPEQGLIRESE